MTPMVKAGQMLGMTGVAVGNATVGILAVVGGMLVLLLKIALSCIVEFVVVVAISAV